MLGLMSAMVCKPGEPCSLHAEEPLSNEKCPGCCDWGECRREATLTICDSEGIVPLYVNELKGSENPIDDVCLCVWHLVSVVERLGRELNNVQ